MGEQVIPRIALLLYIDKKVTPRIYSFVHVAAKRPRIDTSLYAAHIKPLIKAFQRHIICAIISTQYNVMRCSLKGISFTSVLLFFVLLGSPRVHGGVRPAFGRGCKVLFDFCYKLQYNAKTTWNTAKD
jgi:hypothetical protein